MLCTFTYAETSPPVDCQVDRFEMAMPLARQYGLLSLFLPSDSPAFDIRYISEDAPFRVLVNDPKVGVFTGQATSARYTRDGARIDAVHIAKRFEFYTVPNSGAIWLNASAGALVRWGLLAALGGKAEQVVSVGTMLEAAPAIAYYKAAGQTFADLVSFAMERTGQEYVVDTSYRLNWVGETGVYRTAIYADGGFLFPEDPSVNFEGQVSKLTGHLANGQEYTAEL